MAKTAHEARPMAKWDRSKGRPEPIRLLNQVREVENGEPLVQIADIAPKVQIIRTQVIPFLRRRVVEMLADASERLPRGYHLGVVDAWRPFERQVRIYDWIWRSAKLAFPDRNDVALRRTVCRWVAPVDQKAPPGHCTGAAVDLWLIDDDGQPYDVFSPYDRFSAAPTFALGLSDDAQKNRDILVSTMLAVGFSNCRDEWWHYSFGDAGWAVRVGERQCHYGKIDLPAEDYREQELLWQEMHAKRGNPFLEEVI